jgi:hypothetical protein
VVDGKIKEGWGQLNLLDLMGQIGAMPGPEPEQGAAPVAGRPPETVEERNKRVALSLWRDVWNKGNLAAIDEIISDDYAGKIPAQPDLRKAGFGGGSSPPDGHARSEARDT